MQTNVSVDHHLVEEAMTLSQLKSKKEVIQLALNELVQKLRRKEILNLREPGTWTSQPNDETDHE
jgi:Arc/MetJ family transcription regulator